MQSEIPATFKRIQLMTWQRSCNFGYPNLYATNVLDDEMKTLISPYKLKYRTNSYQLYNFAKWKKMNSKDSRALSFPTWKAPRRLSNLSQTWNREQEWVTNIFHYTQKNWSTNSISPATFFSGIQLMSLAKKHKKSFPPTIPRHIHLRLQPLAPPPGTSS